MSYADLTRDERDTFLTLQMRGLLSPRIIAQRDAQGDPARRAKIVAAQLTEDERAVVAKAWGG